MMPTPEEVQQTVDMLKGVYGGGPSAVSPDVVKDFNTNLGLIPYNLEGGAKLLAPVITPIRNMTPRTKGHGKATEFKAITKYDTTGVQGWASEGVSGLNVVTESADIVFPYRIGSKMTAVTLESQMYGRGQVDAKALAVANLLRAFMLDEETRMLFGRSAAGIATSTYYTDASTTPTRTVTIGGLLGAALVPGAAGSTTGGSVPAATYNIYQVAVTGPSDGPLSSLPSTVVNVTTTGATSSITVVPNPQADALSYDIYYKASGDATFNKVNTTGKPVVIIAYTLAGLTLPVTDVSGNALAFNGIMAQLLAAGNGTTVITKNGPLQMGSSTAFGDIDQLYLNMWNTAKADPDWLIVNAFESLTITGGTLGAGTPYYIQPNGEPNGAVAGFRASRFTNKVTGSIVDIKVHPTLPQGTLVALSTKLPVWYPGSDIPSVWAMEMSYDYLELDYPPTQPKWPVEVRNAGAMLCYLPLVNAVLKGISQS